MNHQSKRKWAARRNGTQRPAARNAGRSSAPDSGHAKRVKTAAATDSDCCNRARQDRQLKTLQKKLAVLKQAKERLAESETRLRALSDNLAEGMVYQLDSGTDGQSRRFTFVSSAVQRLHGLSPEEARQNPAAIYNQVIEEDRVLVAEKEARAFATHTALDIEVRMRLPSGELRWRRFISAPRRTRDGRLLWDGIEFDITKRKQAEATMAATQEQLRALLARYEHLREEEQIHLAREVHDVLGQQITALKMDVNWMRGQLARCVQDELRQGLLERTEHVMTGINNLLQWVRSIARGLRPTMLDDLGLEAAMQAETQAFQDRCGIACKMALPAQPLDLNAVQCNGIFRIFQEILTNIARHAHATRVQISLARKARNFHLEVRDNGRGIQAAELNNLNALGLLGMRERAKLLGGRLEIRGDRQHGTTVRLMIPLGDCQGG